MQRQFSAKISWLQWGTVVLLAVLIVFAAWQRQGILFFVALALLAFQVDRIISTAYVVTDDALTIRTSRFFAPTVIPLRSILRIEEVRARRLLMPTACTAVTFTAENGQEKMAYLDPKNPDEMALFVRKKRLKSSENNDEETA